MKAPAPILLEGHGVRLEPIEEAHRDGIRAATDIDLAAFTVSGPGSMPGGADAWTDQALAERAAGGRLPFTVLQDGVVVGSSSYLDLVLGDDRIEIGHTWYGGPWQGTRVNPAAKLLMLSYAFDELGCQRMTLKCDARNARSRRAILGVGAQFEGVLRYWGRRMEQPELLRDAAIFSILDHEWPGVRALLERRLS
jgi:RimJ/RimL family protein N-acetyltransferase